MKMARSLTKARRWKLGVAPVTRAFWKWRPGPVKTITAMICARKLFDEYKPLLIVVAAPYIPLIQQWCDEIEPFGIRPVNLVNANGPSGRTRELANLGRRLRHGSAEVAAIVVSHRTLADGEFRTQLARLDVTKLLIADEVHNLGSGGIY